MRKEQIGEDVYVLTGEFFQSNATALIKDDEVLLIDALASPKDAETLRHFIEDELKKEVRFILCTHFMSDHMAALKLFPRAGQCFRLRLCQPSRQHKKALCLPF